MRCLRLRGELRDYNALRQSLKPAARRSRFDSRPWLGPLPVPTAVVVTSRDDAVPPTKQLALAAALNAPVFDAPIRHRQIGTKHAS